MNVLHVNDTAALVGGREVYLQQLMAAWQKAGHHAVLCTDPAALPYDEIRAGSFDVIHAHTQRLPWVLNLPLPLVKTAHGYQDVCPSGDYFLDFTESICQKSFGPLCLVSPYARGCISRRPNVVWARYQETKVSARETYACDVVIAASAYVRKRLLQNGFSADRIEVLPYASVAPPPADATPEDCILFAGRLYNEKGLHLLMEAMADEHVSLPLVIMGKGSAVYEAKVRRFGQRVLRGRVEWTGWLEGREKEHLLRRAAVVAVPSLWPEPFGIVGLEAMARAKPVVAFDVGGISDWLRNGENGFLVPSGDKEAMGEKIQWLVDRPVEAKRMGQRGRALFEERFSFERHIRDLARIYQKAIDHRRAHVI